MTPQPQDALHLIPSPQPEPLPNPFCSAALQALKLYADNHELATHTMTHTQLYPSYANLAVDILGARDWLVGCGIPKEDAVGKSTNCGPAFCLRSSHEASVLHTTVPAPKNAAGPVLPCVSRRLAPKLARLLLPLLLPGCRLPISLPCAQPERPACALRQRLPI
jgi:hypothetical protein